MRRGAWQECCMEHVSQDDAASVLQHLATALPHLLSPPPFPAHTTPPTPHLQEGLTAEVTRLGTQVAELSEALEGEQAARTATAREAKDKADRLERLEGG